MRAQALRQSATKGSAFGNRKPLKRLDRNFCLLFPFVTHVKEARPRPTNFRLLLRAERSERLSRICPVRSRTAGA